MALGLHRRMSRVRGALLALAAVASALALLAAPAPAPAEQTQPDYTNRKVAAPVVVQYLVEENDNEAWQVVADYAQGEDIPFTLLGTLPENLTRRPRLAYWLVAEPADGLDYVEGSAQVSVIHADGTEEDVTSSLTVVGTNDEIYAGATNIRRALPKLIGSDRLQLTYVTRLNDRANVGLAEGNPSYAHIEYMGTLFLPTGEASVAASRVALAHTGEQAATLVQSSAETQDARTPDLLRSTEIKTTVYSYHLNVHKEAEGTAQQLAGAQFSLRNAHGQWYVRHDSWSPDQSKATVLTTNAQGTLTFPYVDSEYYELVEVAAPQGYKAIDPVDIRISTDVDGNASVTVLSASSARAAHITAEAGTGQVDITIADPKDANTKPDEPTNPDTPDEPTNPDNPANPDNPTNPTNPSDPSADSEPAANADAAATSTTGLRAPGFVPALFSRLLGSPTPTTGDDASQLWAWLAPLSVLALLSGLALRRSAGRMDTHRSSAHGGADKDERNQHGTR